MDLAEFRHETIIELRPSLGNKGFPVLRVALKTASREVATPPPPHTHTHLYFIGYDIKNVQIYLIKKKLVSPFKPTLAVNVKQLLSKGGLKGWLHYPAYTPYEGVNMANQKSRKMGVFGRKLVKQFYCYFDKYERKLNDDAQMFSFSLI